MAMWMCQRMRTKGTSSDDGMVFICNGCNEDAATFLKIARSLDAPPAGPERD
jgi:hypothetical protein